MSKRVNDVFYSEVFEDFDLFLRRHQRMMVNDENGVVKCIKQPEQLDFFDDFLSKNEVKK